MNQNNLLPISKEGWSRIGYSFAAFVVFGIFNLEFLQFFSFLALLFFIFVYRNPERSVSIYEDKSLLSPVDGVIISIDELNDDSEYFYKLVVDCSYYNVSVLRVPMNSTLTDLHIVRGARLSKFTPSSNILNENAELVFEDSDSNRVKVHHMLSQSFDDIKIDNLQSKKIPQGARYGVMVKGITTIYLPKNFRLNVSVGNEIAGSETLIGYFS